MKDCSDVLISVIVPVYKAEDYLLNCLSSILNQTHRNLEVILVDDGSPDRCGEMCDEWAGKDSRIRVIHKENGGASTAKNAALDIAQGEYIGFVDSDDYIHHQMYEMLLHYALEDGSDIVGIDNGNYPYKEILDIKTDGEKRTIVSARVALEQFYQEYYRRIWMSYQTKLFHRDVFQGHRFREGIMFEDTDLLPFTIRRSHQITLIPRQMYNYTLSDDSVMRSVFSKKRFVIIDVWKRYFQAFHEWGLPEQRNYYAVQYLYELVHIYEKIQTEHPEMLDHMKPYLQEFKMLRPWLLSNCSFSRMQRLMLWSFPIFPKIADGLRKRLTR